MSYSRCDFSSNWWVQRTPAPAFSPPMWVCWRFLPKCVPDSNGGCTLTMLYENTLWLNHTFTSAGVHCVDLIVRNDISKLQTSFSLSVKRNSECITEKSNWKVTVDSSVNVLIAFLLSGLDNYVDFRILWRFGFAGWHKQNQKTLLCFCESWLLFSQIGRQIVCREKVRG